MPIIKEFLVKTAILTNNGLGNRTSDTQHPVTISNYSKIREQLLWAVLNPAKLRGLLRAEFIYPEALAMREKVTLDTFPKERYQRIPIYNYRDMDGLNYAFSHDGLAGTGVYRYIYIENPVYDRGRRHTSTFTKFNVAPVLEELVVNHGEDFRSLLASANDLGKTELLNFSNLDLSCADLSNLDPSLINFSGSDLRTTRGITQEFLDATETYVDAQLPNGIIPFWSDDKKSKVLVGIDQLNSYGEKLSLSASNEGREKGILAVSLAIQLKSKISQTTKFNGAFQKEFLSMLHGHDATLSEKRFFGLKMIIANITFAILGLGIGYLAAGLLHQQQTGRFLFFNRTETQQRIDGIQETIFPASAAG